MSRGALPEPESFREINVEQMLSAVSFWGDRPPGEQERLIALCERVETEEIDDYLDVCGIAMVRSDIERGVYEPQYQSDVIAEYRYAPVVTEYPWINFDASSNDFSWVGDIAQWDFPSWALALQADSDDPNVRNIVAHHPHTPPAILEWLAKDPEESAAADAVRYYVAMNPAATRETLTWLINWNQAKASPAQMAVRYAALANPACPTQILIELAKSDNLLDRMSVAFNFTTPPEILAQLADDSSGEVRYYAVNNPGLR